MAESSQPDLLASLRTLAARDPERLAITYEGEPLTRGQLDQRASAVANGLIRLALPRQSRIALLDFNDVSYAEVFFGGAKAGHALCPINVRLAGPEVAWIVNDAQSPVLFVGRDHYGLIAAIEADLTGVGTIIALHGGHPRWTSYAD